MKIKRILNLGDGSCNFCMRGEIKDNGGIGLVYPYSELNVLSGTGVEVRICDVCSTQLKDYLNK